MKQEYAQHLLNQIQYSYNKISGDFANSRAHIWPEISFLFDYIKKGDKVLDWGCANGRLVPLIKQKNADYWGADIAQNLLSLAQKKYPQEKFLLSKPLSLPLPADYFDLIYSIAVFHHIPSAMLRILFLKEGKRVLKPGGFFILTVWARKNKNGKISKIWHCLKKIIGLSPLDFGDIIEKWFGREDVMRYVHFFSEKELKKLARKAGLLVVRSGLIKNESGNRCNYFLIAQKPNPPIAPIA